MKKKRYELTQLHIGKGAEFTAKFGDAEKYDLISLRRDAKYGQPVGDTEISWCSSRINADGAMKMARTLEAVSKIAAVLDARMANGITGGIEQSLGYAGFDVDAAMKW